MAGGITSRRERLLNRLGSIPEGLQTKTIATMKKKSIFKKLAAADEAAAERLARKSRIDANKANKPAYVPPEKRNQSTWVSGPAGSKPKLP